MEKRQAVCAVLLLVPLALTGILATIPDGYAYQAADNDILTPTDILPIGASVYFDVWQATITGADRVDRLEGTSGTVYPDQIFVVALADINNLGYVSDSVSTLDLRVRDSIGRQFDMADLDAQWAAQDQYERTGVYDAIQPGFVEGQAYVFDVALDSEELELIANALPVTPTPNPRPSSIVGLGTPGRFDDWQYTVTDVTTTNTLNGRSETVTARGVFLVILASVQNLGLESDSISRFDFVIQDSATRQFDMADLRAQWAAQDQFDRTGIYDDIQPSFTEDQVYVFDILPELSGLYLVPTNPGDAVDLGQSETPTPTTSAVPSLTPTSTSRPASTVTPTHTPSSTLTPTKEVSHDVYLPLLLRSSLPPTPTPTSQPLPTQTATPTLTPEPGWVEIVYEGFEGDFPTGLWHTSQESEEGSYTWGPRDCRPHAGNKSAWSVGSGADGSELECGSDYPNETKTQLIYGPFDLSDATAAKLTFWTWSNTQYESDTIYWGASRTGIFFWGERDSGSDTSWTYKEFDLSRVPEYGDPTSFLGEPEVWIMFSFESDEWYSREGWFIDDVRIVKRVAGNRASNGTQEPSEPGAMERRITR